MVMVIRGLTLCRPRTPTWVLWQTVKTQMKCHIVWHFIRVCTVKTTLIFREGNIIFWKLYSLNIFYSQILHSSGVGWRVITTLVTNLPRGNYMLWPLNIQWSILTSLHVDVALCKIWLVRKGLNRLFKRIHTRMLLLCCALTKIFIYERLLFETNAPKGHESTQIRG